ncbi:MAG: DegT/DnrJ/EryC1/StrS family aminotransferase [Bacteroidota bacterium]
MRSSFLPFALPDIDQTEIDAVTEVVSSGWLTTGKKTREFEAAFAETVGAKHAVALNSCTAAMHLGLEAMGLQRGDEVITTPYTFAATAEVIRYFDARPVLVDVDPETMNIRADLIEAAITERTKAIIPVHVAGLPADIDEIHEIGCRNGLLVMEDAAHAFPSDYKGRPIGSLSAFTCFSFYATKTITTGEGGMVTTNNEEWANRMRVMALHGISKDAWKRYTAEGSWFYEVVAPGYKYNLTDIASAMGLAQLAKAETMAARREAIARRYHEAFGTEAALQIPADRDDRRHAWHLYPLRLHLDHLSIDRAAFIEELKALNIGTSVHFIPLHLHPYYRETYGYVPEDFPVAYGQYLREVSLPIYSKMSDDDVEDVIEAVLDVVERHRATTGSVRLGTEVGEVAVAS